MEELKTVKRKAHIGERIIIENQGKEPDIVEVMWVYEDGVVVKGDGYSTNIAHDSYLVVL